MNSVPFFTVVISYATSAKLFFLVYISTLKGRQLFAKTFTYGFSATELHQEPITGSLQLS